MKQSAAKTLGVAALGAAFAAAGAGAANAAPALPDAGQATQALSSVTQVLPGTTEALTQGQGAVGTATAAATPAVRGALAKGPTAPVAGLLGGLPTGNTGLPTHGLPVNGLPIG
ncbi:ATP-binding protein [Streptomyces sp. NPDC020192]|uniref:ATP-binding protein n=1 Tax=Streptomyces sp. NPDC020192 TaxID=3365066 RepID=UPI003797FA68